jgi:7-cyano-7-deazaguanine synthase
MRIVSLVSGGLDSTVMALLIKQESLDQIPVFINYGQKNLQRELDACLKNFHSHGLPQPRIVDLPGYGAALPSGLTHPDKHIKNEAFLPGRNLLFLLCAAGIAHQEQADALSIGFLDERLSLFPDQRRDFADRSADVLSLAMMRPIRILTPLIGMTKADVVAVARELGVSGTYSCHAGTEVPCGECIACREYDGVGGEHGR